VKPSSVEVEQSSVCEVDMKTVFKFLALLAFGGAFLVGCGSSNSSSTCSVNGMSGTMVNGACSLTGATSGNCSGSYPYYISSVQVSPYQATPACCNTPTVQTTGTVCVQANTYGYGTNGSCPNGYYLSSTGQCVP
jgi:hypothetical protein